jgi:hypothetical protein
VGEGDSVVAVARVLEAENGNGDVGDPLDSGAVDTPDSIDPVEEA